MHTTENKVAIERATCGFLARLLKEPRVIYVF